MTIKSGWQKHPSTGTAHYFEVTERGEKSICNRDIFVFDGDVYEKPGVFPCSFCLKKINKNKR